MKHVHPTDWQEQIAARKEQIRKLREILLQTVGDGERFPPSAVFVACLDIAAFAATGIDVDKATYLQTAEKIYKGTKVPIEARAAMQAHEERCSSGEVCARRRCTSCGWIGPLQNTFSTKGATSACPKCHGWALVDPDNPADGN